MEPGGLARRARRTLLAGVHVLVTFPLATAAFVVAVTLISTSLGLTATLVGVPLFAASLLVVRLLARLERVRVARFLGERVETLYRPFAGSLWTKLGTLLRDPATWRDVAYFLVLFPVSTATFTLVVTLWSVAGAAATYPLWFWTLPGGGAEIGDSYRLDAPWQVALTCLVGLAAVALSLVVTPALGRLHAALARTLLGPTRAARLRERVDEVTRTRGVAVNAAAAERRRIERDLHDGAQQQMIAVALELGRARERLARDPEGAAESVTRAHEQAKAAIADLRNLARGIHPAVLTDRGLDAALSALAGASPVPVAIRVDVGERPSPAVESIAYFVVAEALANVAKHAGATRAEVEVRRDDGLLHVAVRDDGRGGARASAGGGLEGIAARVASVDGTLTVTSPPGGPTVVEAQLPCA